MGSDIDLYKGQSFQYHLYSDCADITEPIKVVLNGLTVLLWLGIG